MLLSRNLIIPIVVAVSLCGVSGALLYLLLRKDEEEAVLSSQDKCRELRISADIVPSLIGRGGSNIKDLQQTSGARINFRDDVPGADGDVKLRVCVIRGRPEAIRIAEALIQEAVASHVPPRETSMSVPNWAVGRIIGRGGEVIRDICHTSGAKVQMEERNSDTTSATQRKVTLKGTPEQIKMAQEMIDQLVFAEKVRREADSSKREPRGQYGGPGSPPVGPSPDGTSPIAAAPSGDSKKGHLTPEGAGALLEVYVSAVSSPWRFWLQIVGPQVEKLDKLVDEMTDYYNNMDNRELHKLSDVQVGQLVAAVFRHDGKWYRAKVAEIKQNEFDGRQQVCDVHFVDYGDNEYVGREELLGLRTDMLQLRFQAVECFLAGVDPSPQHEPGTWSPRAIERFEELTQVARWKRLWSRTCTFRDRVSPTQEKEGGARRGREGSPVPGVKLYDVQDGVDVDIGEELVKEGWAIEVKESPPTPAPSVPLSVQMPPSFGDLESSRVLGMVVGAPDKREERAISLPHGGVSPRVSPLPSKITCGESCLSGDSKPKSSSLAAGMNLTSKTPVSPTAGSLTKLSYASSDTEETPRITNGTSKQNGAFIDGEKERVALERSLSPKRDGLNPEQIPFHVPDPKDELKAKMNRVDSHHGNLEALGKLNPHK